MRKWIPDQSWLSYCTTSAEWDSRLACFYGHNALLLNMTGSCLLCFPPYIHSIQAKSSVTLSLLDCCCMHPIHYYLGLALDHCISSTFPAQAIILILPNCISLLLAFHLDLSSVKPPPDLRPFRADLISCIQSLTHSYIIHLIMLAPQQPPL